MTQRINGHYQIINGTVVRLFPDMVSPPTVNDDSTSGYIAGDVWISGGVIYQASDVTVGAAVWSTGGGITESQAQQIAQISTFLLMGA
jgi:hypothetical protein